MIITAPKLLTFHGVSAPTDRRAIVVQHGMILNVGPASIIANKYAGHRIANLSNAVLMPGLVNVHAHLELPELLTNIQAATFSEWVLNLVNAKRPLKHRDYRAAATHNIRALIQSGTTTVGEICTHNISPALLKQAGLRTLVFREIIGMNKLSHRAYVNLQLMRLGYAQVVSKLSRPFHRSAAGLMHLGISPHAPYTVSRELLARIKKVARKRNLRIAMHVAESMDEVSLLQRKKSGFENLYHRAGWDREWAPAADSPFGYLHGLGFLGRDFLAIHAVQATDRDIDLMKKAHISVAHCPRSNKETGVGTMPLKKFLDAGITVGLGTDSLASSPSLSMWDEMRYALDIHRGDGITARDIYRIATIGGAKALGMEKETGTIEPGKKADIIAVPLPGRDTGDLYADLLRETKSCIMSVVNGKILFKS